MSLRDIGERLSVTHGLTPRTVQTPTGPGLIVPVIHGGTISIAPAPHGATGWAAHYHRAHAADDSGDVLDVDPTNARAIADAAAELAHFLRQICPH
ncbi:hypothetical protein ACIQU6_30725 [Streptomyces sp. NPDC090442]|uniref:hypothetical protein n=1 Tax=Streptomyces sp. NPDC090442 TaxID=3365962 RepID=UPI0038229448